MYILVDNTPLSKVNRENGVHRQVLIAPWFYFADYVVNTLKLNNVYDPATNPTGIVHRALCALPDDFDITKDPQTEDKLTACDTASRTNVTGYKYAFTGSPMRDSDTKAFSPSNDLFFMTARKNREFAVIDVFGHENDAKLVTPNGDTTVGSHYEIYRFISDDPRDSIKNNTDAAYELNLLNDGYVQRGIVRV